jgi:hypothetical protein
MPKFEKTFPSIQLQSYFNEPRADGAILPFTGTPKDGMASMKKATMGVYLVAWEDNWKRLDAARCV